MAEIRRSSEQTRRTRRPPATTPEAREKQLISLAFDLAEKQLQDGTAATPLITHYLRLGTAQAELEKAKLAADVELAKAKIASMESSQEAEQRYTQALNAMRSYQGQEVEPEE